MSRAAIVEFEPQHDLVLPSLVQAVNRLGFEADVYMPRRLIRADAFALTSGLRYRVLPTDGFAALLRGAPRRGRSYDLTIMNSIEPPRSLRKAERIGGPILAVVHNGVLLRTRREYARFFESRQRMPLVLGEHVAANLRPEWDATWVAPVYVAEPLPRPERGEVVDFCVQGNLEFLRRNYASLLEATDRLMASGHGAFKVTMAGNSGKGDGRAFRSYLAARPRPARIEFTASGIPYRQLWQTVSAADFLLPLVDTSSSRYVYYFVDKVTSTMDVSIGLGAVPVLHERLAEIYGVSDASIRYRDGGLAEAMREAMALPQAKLAAMRGRLDARREWLLDRNVANVRAALEAIG
jgi:hypothetical protein